MIFYIHFSEIKVKFIIIGIIFEIKMHIYKYNLAIEQ